ncbi:glycine--tRNA ligase subunit beta [Sphingomonas cavernae]|uniref:Glycine--tRNA ligase beta subunit n=1 Tax=Sphingomonas cavernae TaxID=2320861 RepID=A0A418W5V0_9SPHN|nr:glycine--tRNA ligase subunit beta [Sphingomonas cavernae]RJF85416.1 glycine--tRNA ligase subunit beta [Sphingomonas cavernae]
MTDFLLELRSEEIPARMQEKASADLARLFVEEIAKSGLKAGSIETFATPRRLALIARDLPLQTEAVSEERKGPRANAPEQALSGFLRSTGLTREQLVERDGVLFAVIEKPGRATAEVIGEAIPAIIRAFPWPKSMRWGATSSSTESLRWVRPLQGIIALLGDDVVPCSIDDIQSGAETVGHRFHHPGCITIGNAGDYAAKLRACHVIVDPAERRKMIAEGAHTAAAAAGLTLVEDPGLVAENAGLTEWPVPLLGSFDPAFLEVPREVIQLTMRTNQKYFSVNDAAGNLAPNFVCTANITASDGGAQIVDGNHKVLAARLSDAKFFWEHDLKIPLEEQAKKLDQIVFHEKLGTVADKVDRVAKLARWLVEEGIVGGSNPTSATTPHRHPRESGDPACSSVSQGSGIPAFAGMTREELAQMAEQAARLAKADLVTGMVGEFPELQGVMGGYYARAQGYPDAVADAIRDHYKPVGQGDDVPTAPVTVAVSLADKLDSLFGFFVINETPSGSRDPFALRRAALAVSRLTLNNNLRFKLNAALSKLHAIYGEMIVSASQHYRLPVEGNAVFLRELNRVAEYAQAKGLNLVLKELGALSPEPRKPFRFIELERSLLENAANVQRSAVDFFADRLKVQQREAGVRHDLIDAVFALGGEDDLVRLLARVKALQAFVQTEDGDHLLTGYRRAANILKKEGFEGAGEQVSLSYTPEKEEADLLTALDAAEPKAEAAVAAENFEGAMAALASLRAPIDAFFDKVTVNDSDPAKRSARLATLARVRDAVHRVADFSRIEG